MMQLVRFKGKKRLTVGAIAVVVVVAGVGLVGVGRLGQKPTGALPDPAAQSNQEVVNYLASADFARQKDAQKRAYLEHLRAQRIDSGKGLGDPAALKLNEQQRKRIRKNMRGVMREMFTRRVEGYFKLPADQREAYLDQTIDRLEVMRRMRGGGKRRPHLTPERLGRMISHTTAQQRAQFGEFMEAMRKRMKERGIDTPY